MRIIVGAQRYKKKELFARDWKLGILILSWLINTEQSIESLVSLIRNTWFADTRLSTRIG